MSRLLLLADETTISDDLCFVNPFERFFSFFLRGERRTATPLPIQKESFRTYVTKGIMNEMSLQNSFLFVNPSSKEFSFFSAYNLVNINDLYRIRRSLNKKLKKHVADIRFFNNHVLWISVVFCGDLSQNAETPSQCYLHTFIG